MRATSEGIPIEHITCQHCSKSVPSRRPANQKWCSTCRVLRGILAMTGSPRRCAACPERFFSTGREDHLCPACSALAVSAPPLQRPCSFCGEQREAIHGLDPDALTLCGHCVANTDAELHRRVLVSVRKRLADTKAPA